MPEPLDYETVARAHGWRPSDEGARLLDDLASFVRRYVVLSPAQVDVIALWTAHTHAIEAAQTTPYLHVTSPEKRCGKTRLLEVLRLLCRDPLSAASASEAALFRALAERPRTLLLDEVDAIFGPKAREREDLRAMLNAGYRRGTPVLRCVGDGSRQRVVEFHVFGAKVLAGIGELPDTLADRCLPLRLKRRAPGEAVEELSESEPPPEAAELREWIRSWVEESLTTLELARPELPEGLDDRGQDAAEPLLAIAELAGGDWPARARRAFVELRRGDDVEEDSLGVRLLADCRRAFELEGADRLTTATLLERLAADEEAPWAEWYGRPLTAKTLAKLLRPYGIRSRTVRLDDGTTAKGFLREQFLDAWRRYLPPSPETGVFPSQASQPASLQGFRGVPYPSQTASVTSHDPLVTDSGEPENPHGYAVVTDVTANPPSGEEGRGGRSTSASAIVGDDGEEEGEGEAATEELTLRLDGRYCTACRDHDRCERERDCAEVRRLASLDRRRRERSAQSARRSEPTLEEALHDPDLFAEYIAPYGTLVDPDPRVERRPATAEEEAELERLREKFPEVALGPRAAVAERRSEPPGLGEAGYEGFLRRAYLAGHLTEAELEARVALHRALRHPQRHDLAAALALAAADALRGRGIAS